MVDSIIKANFSDRTIIKIGQSYAVTLPEKEVKKQQLGLGAVVDVELKCEFEDLKALNEEAEENRDRLEMFLKIIESLEDITLISQIAVNEGLKPLSIQEYGNKEKEQKYKEEVVKEIHNMKVFWDEEFSRTNLEDFDIPSEEDFKAESNPSLLEE